MLIDMTEIVCTGVVDDLAQLIAACRFPSEALFLAEKLPDHVVDSAEERQDLLRFTYFDMDIPFAEYTSGRIFHSDFELRWEKNDAQKTRVVYVGIERSLPALKVERGLNLKKNAQPQCYYLFGKRL